MTVPAPDNEAATRKDLRVRRLRQVLVELDKVPTGLPWPDVWSRVTDVVPLTPDDAEKTGAGAFRGENNVRWYLTELDKSGWLLSGVTPLRITVAGQQALRDFPGAESLSAQANEGYKRWDQLRKPTDEPAETSLEADIVPRTPGERLLLRAAVELLENGLRDGGSAFDPGRRVWGAQNVDALYGAFVQQPDEGADPFVEKLARQLQGAPDDTVLLAAEMLALLLLPLADWKPETKRHRVKQVLAMMQRPVHLSVLTNAAFDHSTFSGGVSFKSMLWRQLSSAIDVARAWWSLGDSQRQATWADPWEWSGFLTSVEGATPSNRAELAYLRYPASFLPIISGSDKALIRDAFADEVPVVVDDVDRSLRDITVALQIKAAGPVDYYESPFVERWRTAPVRPSVRRAWLVRGSSVKGMDLVPTWLDEGFVSLAASQLSSIDLPVEPADLRAAVEAGYGHLPYAKREEKQRDFHAFLVVMQPGDLVVSTSGGRLFVGELRGEPQQTESTEARSNLRWPVDWAEPSEGVEFSALPATLAAHLKGGSDVADLTEVAELIESLIPEDGDDLPPDDEPVPAPVHLESVALPHVDATHAAELLVGVDWLDELVDLLNEKRQVILYGPPGTGKTYLAQKVANAVAPPENVRLVQFHPAYAYEDFFEGYRPAKTDGGQVGFALKPGPFRRIVEDAREHPEQPFVLIIDEINRGNLAKVFGELYFLLEYRDEAINLLYGEEDAAAFSLPKNVYLIGTMNTADRSIALVDTAMRRRFAFLSLHPDDKHLASVLPAWLERNALPVSVARIWDELNKRIPDDEFKIGPSYLMAPSVATDKGLDRIWRTAILPLLEEFHYGDGTDVSKRYGLASLRAAVTPEAAEESGEPGSDDLPGGDVHVDKE